MAGRILFTLSLSVPAVRGPEDRQPPAGQEHQRCRQGDDRPILNCHLQVRLEIVMKLKKNIFRQLFQDRVFPPATNTQYTNINIYI